MERHPLGDAGPLVTRLGLGLAALGRPGYITLGHAGDLDAEYDPAAMEARAHAVCDAAWAAGVRYFDAARSYGRAEEFLGGWLRARRLDPAAVTVGSKWGYTYTAGWRTDAPAHEVKEHSLPVLRRQWAESQASLGPYLRLYQIHSATIESGVLDSPEVLGELARLRAGGLAIGLSVSGPRQPEVIRRALAVRVDGARLFDAVQATWNLLEPSAGPALAEAHAAGLGVIVKEALANGRLAGRNNDPAFAPSRAALAAQAARLGCALDALAIAAALAQPWAGVVLSGAAPVEHLPATAAGLAVAWDAQAAAALAPLAEAPEAYWQTRAALPWN
ncbi:MAG: aldo/keto reductase [Chloroflexales bacterium]|nr:aldo/keto reductase [Chloroflexales bacterium]